MTRRRWTEETVEATLREAVADLGRFPTRAELTARDAGGAWTAMQRLGGVDRWREALADRPAASVAASAADVAVRAYFIAQERQDGDVVAHWFDAERELLATA